MSYVIEAERLSKEFRRLAEGQSRFRRVFRPVYEPVKAVTDVDFKIATGDVVAFIGPNGAGKSTIINMLCGILEPNGGRAKVLGFTPLPSRRRLASRISVIFGGRHTQLLVDLPLIYSLKYAAALYQVPKAERAQRILEVVDRLRLWEFLYQKVNSLSTGQKRRGDIAAALLHRPEVIFMDEPTDGLDAEGRQTFHEIILEINRYYGTTIVITSHQEADIALTKTAFVILNGELMWQGPTQALRERYLTRKLFYVRAREHMPVVRGVSPERLPDGRVLYAMPTGTSVNQYCTEFDEHGLEALTVEDPSWADILRKIYRGELGDDREEA